MKKALLKLSTASTFFVLAAGQTYAQVTTITLSRTGTAGVSNLSSLVSAGFNVAIIFAILFVFAMLILGGYGWITAGGDKAKVEEARTRITNALIGMAIIASAWAIITIVAKFFGVDFEKFDIPSASGS